MCMPIAIMPGSYDPPTRGHVDLIVRAARCFDGLIVAVGSNVNKDPWFSASERAQLLMDSIEALHLPPELSIRVVTYDGLLVDCAREEGATIAVKGIRDGRDLSGELIQAAYNRELAEIETLLLPAAASLQHISSSAVKELVFYGVDPAPYVPGPVQVALRPFLAERKPHA